MLQHATCVAIDGAGVLLLGPSGAGKSDLALRLLQSRWHWDARDVEVRLVADDQVLLALDGGRLMASSPPAIAGKLEVRGLGIVQLGAAILSSVPVRLAVELVRDGGIERFPETERALELMAVRVPLIAIAPFEASAAAKVVLAAIVQCGRSL
jgi:serine kinase of HPr protein (carbohydrate metabolism regulator)